MSAWRDNRGCLSQGGEVEFAAGSPSRPTRGSGGPGAGPVPVRNFGAPAIRVPVGRSLQASPLSDASRRTRMSPRKMSTVALAAAAAMLFSTAAITTASAADTGKVKCAGVNACKGQSACKSANNACKGMNSCKGKGFKEMTKAQCDHAKGKVIE